MTTLTGTTALRRVVVSEVTEDPNTQPRFVVAGTSGSVQAGGGQPKTDELVQTGEFRQYGNGNIRLILGSAQGRTETLALMAISEADVTTLTELLGHTVVYRTPDGVRIFGAFLDMQVVRLPNSGGLRNVGLVIQSLSYDEEV